MYVRTSLLPRPNPLITGPEIRMGKGGSGPESGPTTSGRDGGAAAAAAEAAAAMTLLAMG